MAQNPENASALHFLGVLSHQRGDDAAALELMRRALALAPDDVAALNNLGNIHLERAALADAEGAYRKALALRPDFADGHNNLGLVLGMLDRPEEAEAALERAIALEPRRADFHHNLGLLLRRRGALARAIATFRAALTLDPGRSRSFEAMIQAQYRHSRTPADTIATLKEWLARDPDHAGARHILSALTGEGIEPRASDRYIKRLFDGYATSFDEHLEHLDYVAPRLLAAAVGRALGAPGGQLSVLDAGCGTGRWAELLRPFARELVGVDLSGGMLEQARRNRGYDRLEEAELTAYLAAHPRAFDLVFSADTLVYFGDLGLVTRAAADALRAGGLFAFTVEQLDDDGTGAPFVLHYNGRFAHARHHLVEAMGAAGLDIASLEAGALRSERHKPVNGWVMAARKPLD
ncbi:tetratricopeptide repeat protein [Aliidongia dinghuensis]|uniref:tetratricopeptide repeat protein n=1 Tax=Aliidongia dinghuensis TaxID=1867774 RepID=UPI00389926A5